jgi:hypothetical protein
MFLLFIFLSANYGSQVAELPLMMSQSCLMNRLCMAAKP